MLRSFITLAALVALAFAQTTAPQNPPPPQLITSLPGYDDDISFNMYSGYIPIDPATGKNYFFILTEAQENPDEAPLLFWYNGGPGCSGMLGLFWEHGPFQVNPDLSISERSLAWNKFANVVYLEQPAGVGFSYSTTESDYTTDDFQSAKDNYVFIENFLKEFASKPYASNQVFVAGESYAGVYIPTLISEILDNADNSTVAPLFAGAADGNPVFSCASSDYLSMQFHMFSGHTLVSQTNKDAWVANDCDTNSDTRACFELFLTTMKEVGPLYQELDGWTYLGDQPSLDPDCLYTDFITGNATLEFSLNHPSTKTDAVGSLITEYLNQETVQEALGAYLYFGSDTWAVCSGYVNYTANAGSMIPYWQKLIDQRPDVNILIYSGDVDIATVPPMDTQICLQELAVDADLVTPWQPWFVDTGATAGYTEEYSTYSFATIRGAGHTVPQYQGFVAYTMIERFLNTGSVRDESVVPQEATFKRGLAQGDKLRELDIIPDVQL